LKKKEGRGMADNCESCCKCFDDVHSLADIRYSTFVVDKLLKNIDKHINTNIPTLQLVSAYTLKEAFQRFEQSLQILKNDFDLNGQTFIEFNHTFLYSKQYVTLLKQFITLGCICLESFYQPYSLVSLQFLKTIFEVHYELLLIHEQYENLKNYNVSIPIFNKRSNRKHCNIYFSMK
jgi:hypothetical protein